MKTVLLTAVLLCLSACSSSPPTRSGKSTPRVKPELMLTTEDAPLSAGDTKAVPVPQSLVSRDAVLIGPDVIAYPIAGRQDPNHPDLAYDGTWAFRRTAPRWKLSPAPDKDLVIGPSRSESRQNLKPAQTQEFETLLLEQRTLNDQNRQAITRLIRLQADQQRQLAEIHQAVTGKDKNGSPPTHEEPTSEPAKPAKPAAPAHAP